MKEYAPFPERVDDSRLGDDGGGSAVTARDSTPNTTLLARVAPCYHLMLLYICGDMWRARSEARSNTPHTYLSPLESDQRRGACSKDLVMSHGPYEASAA